MSFKEIQNIKIEYRTLSDDVVESFYIPCLSKAKRYNRAVGFFSSSILVQISKGLCAFAKNKGKMKLLISPKLEEKDYLAIEEGYKFDYESYLKDKFFEDFNDSPNIEEMDRYALLSYLISNKILDVRVAVLEKNFDNAMYHEKMGIMVDEEDNKIAFSGSANETYNGFNLNYEAIDVFCSWKSQDSEIRTFTKETNFDKLWNGTEKGIITLKFSEVIESKLLKYRRSDKERILNLDIEYLEKLRKNKKKKNEPFIDNNINLHYYQEEAILEWQKRNYRGIYDMATGTGKTFTGAASICKLFEDKKRLLAVIVCPYIHLVDQWYNELQLFNIDAVKCYGNKNKYQKDLDRRLMRFKQKRSNFVCILITNKSFMIDNFQSLIQEYLEDCLLLVDEAHNFGADKLSNTLNVDYPYRLALSATLERYGDSEGTEKLFDFFGEKCITYSLDRAIIEDKLTKYKYFPILVNLTDDELDEYIDLSIQISKYSYVFNKEKKKIPDKVKKLLLRRARKIAGAQNKIPALLGVINKYKNDNNLLIYCGAVKYGEDGYDSAIDEKKQIQVVIEELKEKLGMITVKFTSEETTEEREDIISSFKNQEIQGLVAIKCLDEGMNIPAIKTAFILASSTNPKEYIQRRGRVLRKSPGKKYSEIYDFITISRPIEELIKLSYDDKKYEVSLALKELDRVKDFARLSLNPSDSNEIIDKIKQAYDLDIITVRGVEDYE